MALCIGLEQYKVAVTLQLTAAHDVTCMQAMISRKSILLQPVGRRSGNADDNGSSGRQ